MNYERIKKASAVMGNAGGFCAFLLQQEGPLAVLHLLGLHRADVRNDSCRKARNFEACLVPDDSFNVLNMVPTP
jgi:hypothetical protein